MNQRQRLAIIEKLTNKYFSKLAQSKEFDEIDSDLFDTVDRNASYDTKLLNSLKPDPTEDCSKSLTFGEYGLQIDAGPNYHSEPKKVLYFFSDYDKYEVCFLRDNKVIQLFDISDKPDPEYEQLWNAIPTHIKNSFDKDHSQYSYKLSNLDVIFLIRALTKAFGQHKIT